MTSFFAHKGTNALLWLSVSCSSLEDFLKKYVGLFVVGVTILFAKFFWSENNIDGRQPRHVFSYLFKTSPVFFHDFIEAYFILFPLKSICCVDTLWVLLTHNLCRYIDPSDPTKLYLQQPFESQPTLRRRNYSFAGDSQM